MLRTLTFALLLLPAAASARDWAVDASKSTLGFKGSYQGEAFTGSFRTFDATIAYDAADPSKGKFKTINDGYQSQIDDINTTISKQNDILTQKEQQLSQQFADMETAVNNLKGLQTQLSSLGVLSYG